MSANVTEHPARETLAAFLSGLVTIEEQERIACHLDSCEACCQLLAKSTTSGDDPLLQLLEQVDSEATLKPDSYEAAGTLSSGSQRYEFGDEIARGGMGVVFRAFDKQLRRQVAIKVPKEGGHRPTQRFQRLVNEAQLTGQIQHPGVPPVYELGHLPDQRPFMAMKLIEGTPLAELLRVRSVPDAAISSLLPVFGRLCDTVAFAHSVGIIHRDLKPSNVLVGQFGETQVVDWGLAKPWRDGCDDEHSVNDSIEPSRQFDATLDGAMVGTPAYMAPEQAVGRLSDIGPHTDVFALGSMLCEILTGTPAFSAESIEEVIELARNSDTSKSLDQLRSSGADPVLKRIVEDCLNTDIAQRPATALLVADRIRDYQQSAQEQLREAELQRARTEAAANEQQKRSRLKAIFAGVFAICLLLAAVAWNLSVSREARRSQTFQRQTGEAIGRTRELQNSAIDLAPSGLDRWAQAIETIDNAKLLAEQSKVKQLIRSVAEVSQEVRQQQVLAIADRQLLDELQVILLSGPKSRSQRPSGLRQRKGPPDSATWRLPKFEEAFRTYGLHPLATDPDAATQRLRERPESTLAAISDALNLWFGFAHDREPETATWIIDVFERFDTSTIRNRIRNAIADGDIAMVEAATKNLAITNESPIFLSIVIRYLDRQDSKIAITFMQRAQAEFAGDRLINQVAAEMYQRRGRSNDAIAHYLAALASSDDPRFGFHYARRLAQAFEEQGESERAIAYWQRAALGEHVKQADVLGEFGEALLRAERFEEAEIQLRKAIGSGASRLATLWLSIAAIEEHYGNIDAAITAAKAAIDSRPPGTRRSWNMLRRLEAKRVEPATQPTLSPKEMAAVKATIDEASKLLEAKDYAASARLFRSIPISTSIDHGFRPNAARAAIAATINDSSVAKTEAASFIQFAHDCLLEELLRDATAGETWAEDPIINMTRRPFCTLFLNEEEANRFKQIWDRVFGRRP